MNRHRRTAARASVLATVVLVTLLSGCGSSRADEETDFNSQVESAIEEARSGGASDGQLALLEQSASDGEVSIESARAGARSFVRCMIESGYHAEYVEEPDTSGLVIPGSRVRSSDGDDENALTAAMDECDTLESLWVNRLYQTQPISAQQREEYMNALIPQMRRCLTEAGYPVDDNATATELRVQIAEVEAETNADLGCFVDN